MSSTVQCNECRGEGGALFQAHGEGALETLEWRDCIHCNGSSECDCRDCNDAADEAAWERAQEGEPPLSAQEQYEAAWRQKQELRR